MMLWRLCAVAAVFGLTGCAIGSRIPHTFDPQRVAQIIQLLPADAIFLGEQHDVPDHQHIHQLAVETLASQQALTALALEMAPQGHSTEKLPRDAGEEQVRAALAWDNNAWPWAAYGAPVMAAVRAGVPVVGANLPASRQREAMQNTGLDKLLTSSALQAQQQAVRSGHCNMLPESQIAPMTRIQIARDLAMAETATHRARPGKTVLLLAGSGHVDRNLGVPQHLAQSFKVKTVMLHAKQAPPAIEDIAAFDHVWATKLAPEVDYCAEFAARKRPPAP